MEAGGTKQLWMAVKGIAGGEEKKNEPSFSVEGPNTDYADISTDPTYQQLAWKLTAHLNAQ